MRKSFKKRKLNQPSKQYRGKKPNKQKNSSAFANATKISESIAGHGRNLFQMKTWTNLVPYRERQVSSKEGVGIVQDSMI